MAIQKIEQTMGIKSKAYTAQSNMGQVSESGPIQTPVKPAPVDSKLLQKYYVSFGARRGQESEKTDVQMFLEQNNTKDARALMNRATQIAKDHKHKEVGALHFEKATLESLSHYVDDLDSGAKTWSSGGAYRTPFYFADVISPDIFKDKKEREKIKPVLEAEMKNLDEMLAKIPKSVNSSEPLLSEELMDGAIQLIKAEAAESGVQAETIAVEDTTYLNSMYITDQNLETNQFRKFLMKFSEAFMVDSRKPEEKIALHAYDDKAKIVFKNLALGTNMFVTHEEKAEPMFFVDTLVEAFANQKEGFGAINPSNTQITVLNSNMQEGFLAQKVRELGKDKDKTHIVIFDQDELLAKTAREIQKGDGTTGVVAGVGEDFIDTLKDQPKNVRFVLLQEKGNYYLSTSTPVFQKIFENFGEVSFPVLSTEQTKKAFREQPLLMKKIEIPFTKTAIDKVIDASVLLDGSNPGKVQKLMKKMASYYVGKSEINETDAKKYMEEAKDLFKVTGDGSSVEVVFDTGKKTKDILGKEATKKEAEAIVKQIKNGTLGTKGAIIYSQDGSVGSGRRFTAKAIAGEAKIPYVEINADDFGTKEVDLFGGGVLSPESSIKKLFSLVKTQAEANASKSAVLFVENFEYFSVGELISPFHQKAMSQMLREMDNASKQGLNILVLGSVRDPQIIGESTVKSFKFVDRIEVESPAMNTDARNSVLSNAIKEQKLKLAGAVEDKTALVKFLSEITEGSPFNQLIALVKKVKSVAMERDHKEITKGDFVEAFLQLTTGRTSPRAIPEYSKNIVTSHECGHATNLEVMGLVAEKMNIPWRKPEKVSFVTLDPRGWYGGAVYHSENIYNEEQTFEKGFAQIVCSYGGHSAEKKFFGIDGSLGITSDIESATHEAEVAVGYMGQGKKFGKQSLSGMVLPPSGKDLEKFKADSSLELKQGCQVSDLITEGYADFNKEFTQKYSKLVGTGDCIIPGDVFRQELYDWISRQSKSKRSELEVLHNTILTIQDRTKNGKEYNAKAITNSLHQTVSKLFHTIKIK